MVTTAKAQWLVDRGRARTGDYTVGSVMVSEGKDAVTMPDS
jgi:hypothetical protein